MGRVGNIQHLQTGAEGDNDLQPVLLLALPLGQEYAVMEKKEVSGLLLLLFSFKK